MIHNVTLEFDRQRLQQVVLNLAKNAVKFSLPNGEDIVISSRIVAKPGSLISQSKQLEVSVQDRGLGIHHSELEHVFTPFFSTNDEQSRNLNVRGHALGLSICK